MTLDGNGGQPNVVLKFPKAVSSEDTAYTDLPKLLNDSTVSSQTLRKPRTYLPQEMIDLILKRDNPLRCLPDDILAHISGYLDLSSRCLSALTCKDIARLYVRHLLLHTTTHAANSEVAVKSIGINGKRRS
jgi:F-box-like